jgi:quinoprotein glucose dehydrogenase
MIRSLTALSIALVGTTTALGAQPTSQVTAAQVIAAAGVPAGPSRAGVAIEWTAYGRDAGGSKYSPASQITRDNVRELVPVWTYRTGDFGRGDGAVRDETTPLFVDGVLYASTPFGGVRALNPSTGAELWSFDAELDLSHGYGDPTNRGVSTWLDTKRAATNPCRRRIYIATLDARLIALDARTGRHCADFGNGGEVDLTSGLRNAPEYRGEFGVTSAPAIVGDLVIVGATVADNRRLNAPAGVVQAFDARTGARRWSWDPVPQDPSSAEYATWRGPNAHQTGAANAWATISADPARDMIFVPTGSASPDFYGGERLGRNDFANSIVAIRASTGKVLWHFQVVHHDLWDYDVPAQPALVDLQRNGATIPALVQTTKMGYVFVLNRLTGQPLFPVEERPVPKSDVAGEQAWPTQPVPTLPRPLGPTRLDTPVFAVSDNGRSWCESELAGARSEGIFTPPSVQGTVIFPGNVGGSNWSGVAIDPNRRVAIIPSNRLITVAALIPRADVQRERMGGTRFNEFAAQSGTPYAMHRTHLIGPEGVPCNAPPWGVLTAIDLQSGATLWEKPYGRVPQLAAMPGSEKWGSPNLGGVMVTASGLIFGGGAVDQSLHAYDIQTGSELWPAQLPAGVHGSPMTYVNASGDQYVVVAAGGHREFRDTPGDYIVAFALRSRVNPFVNEHAVASGHYRGHLMLDRTRLPATLDLVISGSIANVSFETSNPRVIGQGTGRVSTDSLSADLSWTFPAQNCSGTLQLRGTPANDGRDLIGELEYVDGCTDHRTKQGTFAVRRQPTAMIPITIIASR